MTTPKTSSVAESSLHIDARAIARRQIEDRFLERDDEAFGACFSRVLVDGRRAPRVEAAACVVVRMVIRLRGGRGARWCEVGTRVREKALARAEARLVVAFVARARLAHQMCERIIINYYQRLVIMRGNRYGVYGAGMAACTFVPFGTASSTPSTDGWKCSGMSASKSCTVDIM